MQTDNRLLDDLARVATGALGALTGVRSEIEGRLREQFERVLSRMDLVTREEFDAVKAMAAKARAEQESLAHRLEMLEQRLAQAEERASQPLVSRPVEGGPP
jgi:BMFP domain-containing protein YqiC